MIKTKRDSITFVSIKPGPRLLIKFEYYFNPEDEMNVLTFWKAYNLSTNKVYNIPSESLSQEIEDELKEHLDNMGQGYVSDEPEEIDVLINKMWRNG